MALTSVEKVPRLTHFRDGHHTKYQLLSGWQKPHATLLIRLWGQKSFLSLHICSALVKALRLFGD